MIFYIQALSSKGKLTNPEMIGTYTRKFQSLKEIPKCPNEMQKNAILSIENKIKKEISPFVNKVWKESFDKGLQKTSKKQQKKY